MPARRCSGIDRSESSTYDSISRSLVVVERRADEGRDDLSLEPEHGPKAYRRPACALGWSALGVGGPGGLAATGARQREPGGGRRLLLVALPGRPEGPTQSGELCPQ